MKSNQKALVVSLRPDRTEGLAELNAALGRGWRVTHLTPMGGAGAGGQTAEAHVILGVLVILERNGGGMSGILEQVHEEAESLLEEIAEGDGSSMEIDDDDLGEERPRGS